MDPAENALLDGRYRLREILGQGGMADVWAAVDEEARRDVAVKLLRRPPGREHSAYERFRREAAVLRALRSDRVCRLLDVGRTRRGRPYLVFERLRGETLAERLRRHGALAFATLLPLVDDVLVGLVDAHAAGVYHRDLKPSNVFLELSDDGLERAKLLDFGVAKRAASDEEGGLTSEGAVLGSLDYMSPEQVGSASSVDARSDVYSAGATAFHAATGRRLFESPTAAAAIAMKLARDAPGLGEVTGDAWPEPVERFFRTALAREPGRRFESAAGALAAWRALGGAARDAPKPRLLVTGVPLAECSDDDSDTLPVHDPLLSPRRRRRS